MQLPITFMAAFKVSKHATKNKKEKEEEGEGDEKNVRNRTTQFGTD